MKSLGLSGLLLSCSLYAAIPAEIYSKGMQELEDCVTGRNCSRSSGVFSFIVLEMLATVESFPKTAEQSSEEYKTRLPSFEQRQGIYQLLRKGIESPDPVIARQSLSLLVDLGGMDKKSLELTQKYLSSPLPDLRRAAYYALLENTKDHERRQSLILAALNDIDPEVQQGVTFALLRLEWKNPIIQMAIKKFAESNEENKKFLEETKFEINDGVASETKLLASILGDSISVGYLSAANLKGYKPLIREMGTHGIYYLGEMSFASLLQDKNYTLSWFNSKERYSFVSRLSKFSDRFRLDNKSRLATTTDDGVAMAKAAVIESWKTPLSAEKFFTVFYGGNDICSSMNSASYIENVKRILILLSQVESSKAVKVLLVGPPPIHQIKKPEIWQTPSLGGWTCEKIHTVSTEVCEPLYKNPREVQEKEKEYNSGLKLLAQEFNRPSKFEVVATDVLSKMNLQPQHLSWDCFHPSLIGQRAISEALWSAQPWFH